VLVKFEPVLVKDRLLEPSGYLLQLALCGLENHVVVLCIASMALSGLCRIMLIAHALDQQRQWSGVEAAS
jgi:hypothetical protein